MDYPFLVTWWNLSESTYRQSRELKTKEEVRRFFDAKVNDSKTRGAKLWIMEQKG